MIINISTAFPAFPCTSFNSSESVIIYSSRSTPFFNELDFSVHLLSVWFFFFNITAIVFCSTTFAEVIQGKKTINIGRTKPERQSMQKNCFALTYT